MAHESYINRKITMTKTSILALALIATLSACDAPEAPAPTEQPGAPAPGVGGGPGERPTNEKEK